MASAPLTALAQDDATATSILLAAEAVEPADVTLVSMGVRRGAREIAGVRYRHLGDVIGMGDPPAEIFDAVSSLDSLAERLRAGDASVVDQAERVVEVFEENLAFVRRSNLIDAHMIRAIAHCLTRRGREECERGFQHVVTFRETHLYDPERYPPDQATIFDEVKSRVVDTGLRGSVEIVTEPPGAEVFVDGRSYGPAPAVAEGLIVGDHYVTVKAQGYEEVIRRVTVEESFQATAALTLFENDRAALVNEQLPRVREELGSSRAGPGIQALARTLTSLMIFGHVRAGEGDGVAVDLYLYHDRTHFMLAHEQLSAPRVELEERVRQAMNELFEGVDLSGRVAAPDTGPHHGDDGSIWEQWWFWTAVGVVAVSGAIAAGYLLTLGGAECPDGWTCFDGRVQ